MEVTVRVSWGCRDEGPQPGPLRTAEIYSPVMIESRRLRPSCLCAVPPRGAQGESLFPLWLLVAPMVLGVLGLWLHHPRLCLLVLWPPLVSVSSHTWS